MYDLIAGHPPFDQEEIASVLWRIGSGQTTSLQDIDCNARLKVNFAFVTLDVDHYKKKGLYHLTLARCEFQHFSHFFFCIFIECSGVDRVLLVLRCVPATELRWSCPAIATVGAALQIAFVFGTGAIESLGHVQASMLKLCVDYFKKQKRKRQNSNKPKNQINKKKKKTAKRE